MKTGFEHAPKRDGPKPAGAKTQGDEGQSGRENEWLKLGCGDGGGNRLAQIWHK